MTKKKTGGGSWNEIPESSACYSGGLCMWADIFQYLDNNVFEFQTIFLLAADIF